MIAAEYSAAPLLDERAILCSVFFDAPYYAHLTGLSEAGERELARHYLNEGWRAGHNPSEYFSTRAYLDRNPDVVQANVNPLLHYLRYGRAEGRPRLPADGYEEAAAAPVAPTAEEWARLAAWGPNSMADEGPCVIVPVYSGYAETLRCLYSVLAARQRTPFRLIVVDDNGPDPALRAFLATLAEQGLIELAVTDRNRGFVHAVNLGMTRAAGRDVVLLNADAEVHNDWLDRLLATASADPRIGTVTPLTNNGEIASYPRWCENNWRRLELGDAALDRLLAGMAAEPIAAPTAVGFCMYIRAACLAETGAFDEAAFKTGYGEENDFSQRAARLGWRNVIAPNIFVRHHGAVSFGSQKEARIRDAMEAMSVKHPSYGLEVSQYLRARPAEPLWRAIDIARLNKALKARRFLYVCHDRGGGTAKHMSDMEALLLQEGVSVIRCESQGGEIRLYNPAVPETPSLRFPIAATVVAELTDVLARLKIGHIHVHSLLGFGPDFPEILQTVARRLRVSYDYTFHDYAAICPRIDFCDGEGNYCGEPSTDECDLCVATYGAPVSVPSTATHRARHERFLKDARAVFTPNKDVEARVRRYFPRCQTRIRAHPEGAVTR